MLRIFRKINDYFPIQHSLIYISQKWLPKTVDNSCPVALTYVIYIFCFVLVLWMYETYVYKFCIKLSCSKLCDYWLKCFNDYMRSAIVAVKLIEYLRFAYTVAGKRDDRALQYQHSHGMSEMCRPASDANEWCD
jgi:uncharacterized membrane protein